MTKKLNDCWIITEGIIGTENQCIGVAEALGVTPVIKRIKLRQPWKSLSPYLKLEAPWAFTPSLTPPWPDLLIAGGRKSVAAARYIKKASGGKTFVVQLQDPKISASNFDLVAAPAHDSIRGENVILTTAAPNRITTEKLEAAKKQFPQFGDLKSPRIAVLIGGNSRAYKMTPEITRALSAQLKTLSQTHGLMITASRRTGNANKEILLSQLQPVIPAKAGILSGINQEDSGVRRNDGNIYFWNGSGENPYFALLAWADFILVTADSVSMLSDAATTGKPVYIIPLEGGSKRLKLFHSNLINRGIARFFTGKLESWTYAPLRDAQKIADEIKKRFYR